MKNNPNIGAHKLTPPSIQKVYAVPPRINGKPFSCPKPCHGTVFIKPSIDPNFIQCDKCKVIYNTSEVVGTKNRKKG